MNLEELFLYDKDVDLSEIYENLSRQLKVMHSNNIVVKNMNSYNIMYDKDISFNEYGQSDNFEKEKQDNIVTLSKIMLGFLLSKNNTFRDYSNINTEWFIDNFDNIFSIINEENFDKEYFHSVLIDKESTYYSDYLDYKRNKEELSGKSNVQGYKKVLKTAASSLYSDDSYEDNNDIKDKSAMISTAFNPILISGIIIILFIFITFILLVK